MVSQLFYCKEELGVFYVIPYVVHLNYLLYHLAYILVSSKTPIYSLFPLCFSGELAS